ncbi:cytidine deaminase [Stackebrandtia albiflava]|uniref:Cytidine deaminase n=1 Tax=Stackebrandtia albiflava TaxID=406432 RepID=A0A562VAW2_9ACTN|nr:cytidine deaminase [Stackebrandtia albiflava]TWJ14947.1 cytidine deaminase [Stackebrandtia albiflava]
MELTAEDEKLVTLARSAAARIGAPQGAAVRDDDGRTYAAASVRLPSLRLTALQLAVAQAVGAGAEALEAAAVVAEDGADEAGLAAVRDVTATAPVYQVTGDGISQVSG